MTIESVEELVERLRRLTADERTDEVYSKGTAELLTDFNVGAIPDELRHRAPDVQRGRYMVHREPRFNITTLIWAPGERADAHDHRTWGTILVVENEIEETRYEVTSIEARMAKLDVVDVHRHQSGATSTLFSGNDVHAMYNATGTDTLEIHIYGDDLAGKPRSWWRADGTEESLVSSPYLNC